MKFARWIFLVAGIFGLLVTVPLAFAEKVVEVKQPEFYYGFVFQDICWQILYLFVSSNPVRLSHDNDPRVLGKSHWNGSPDVALLAGTNL
jgi:hypothetical protein